MMPQNDRASHLCLQTHRPFTRCSCCPPPAALLSHFQRLVKLERARNTADVESAVPLPADVRASIHAGLARTYGPGITVSFAHNPGLIGGVRIKVGSDVFDGSVRARLAELQKSF